MLLLLKNAGTKAVLVRLTFNRILIITNTLVRQHKHTTRMHLQVPHHCSQVVWCYPWPCLGCMCTHGCKPCGHCCEAPLLSQFPCTDCIMLLALPPPVCAGPAVPAPCSSPTSGGQFSEECLCLPTYFIWATDFIQSTYKVQVHMNTSMWNHYLYQAYEYV